MSRKSAPTLHVEWSPGWVQAVDVATGQTAAGACLCELGPITEGHRHVLVGVGRGLVFLRTLRLPKALPDDLRRILSVQLAQLFPLPPDQLAFDFLQTADHTADGYLTVIGAMRAEDLKQLLGELQQANMTAARILPVSLGAPAVAAHAGAADALLMESSAAGLALDVVQGGIVRFSRVAPGGNEPLAEAERTLAAAGVGDLPLVSAGSVALPGARPASGTALGLLHEAPHFGFELAEDRVREAARRAATRTRLAALMMLSALLLVALVWADRGDARAVVRRGEGAWARQLGKLRSTRTMETAKAQKAVAIQTALDRAFAPAQPLSDMMWVVGDHLPAGAWLTGLSIERGKPLQIRGTARTADDVARFVGALGANPRFRDVRLVFANNAKIEETPVVQFNVTAVGVGNLPMPAPVKAAGGAR